MKKVLFIAHALCDPGIAGIHRYTLEILNCLDKIVGKNEVELLIPASEKDEYDFEHIKVVKKGIKIPLPGLLGIRTERFFEKNIIAPIYAKWNDAVTVDLELQFPLFRCDVIAVYDCRVNKFPEYYSFSKQQRRNRRVVLRHQDKAMQKCKAVITDSETIKKELNDCYQNETKPVYVAYCGWQHFNNVIEDETVLKSIDVFEKNYFFCLGSRFPHKNIRWVSCAAKAHPEYTFVISGSERGNSNFEFEGKKLPNMIFAGRLSDPEVKALMRHCKAFIQPSLYEGFGIPPLEAMSVGADCIVSDIPVFREVYQDSVWYIDPKDYEHINLDQIMAQKKDLNDIILEKYSWEKSAKKLWEVLKEVAGE